MHIIPPECDIRINHGLYPCSNAVIRKLGEMRRMMVASAAYLAKHGVPKTPEDLEFHELLGGNDLVNGAPLVLLKDNERVIVPIHSKLRLKDHTAARTAALFDAGISVHAFRYDTMELVRRKLLIHVLPDWEPEPSPVSLLLPIGRNHPQLWKPCVTSLLKNGVQTLNSSSIMVSNNSEHRQHCVNGSSLYLPLKKEAFLRLLPLPTPTLPLSAEKLQNLNICYRNHYWKDPAPVFVRHG